MNTISAKLTQIKVNGENPRSITNDKLNKLVNSILVFPKMLSIRPIVVDDKMVALGGNMRLNALKIIVKMSPEELGTRLATIPDYLKKSAGERENIARHWEAWLKSPVVEIIKASELTEDERKQFIIKDNVSFGTWDYDALANGWDESSLGDWGMDVWQMQPTSFSQPVATAPTTYPSAPAASEVDGEVVFESALPAELQGVDLTPAELPKIQGDDQTAVERVIIVFPKDKEPIMAQMLGLGSIDKVVYKIEELIAE
ncbi:MAG: hypothetical protein J6V00_07740 [Bacteroidaceae bacterium]|nr:hypothetical protein [Bacteroidaceae bacterium]